MFGGCRAISAADDDTGDAAADIPAMRKARRRLFLRFLPKEDAAEIDEPQVWASSPLLPLMTAARLYFSRYRYHVMIHGSFTTMRDTDAADAFPHVAFCLRTFSRFLR